MMNKTTSIILLMILLSASSAYALFEKNYGNNAYGAGMVHSAAAIAEGVNTLSYNPAASLGSSNIEIRADYALSYLMENGFYLSAIIPLATTVRDTNGEAIGKEKGGFNLGINGSFVKSKYLSEWTGDLSLTKSIGDNIAMALTFKGMGYLTSFDFLGVSFDDFGNKASFNMDASAYARAKNAPVSLSVSLKNFIPLDLSLEGSGTEYSLPMSLEIAAGYKVKELVPVSIYTKFDIVTSDEFSPENYIGLGVQSPKIADTIAFRGGFRTLNMGKALDLALGFGVSPGDIGLTIDYAFTYNASYSAVKGKHNLSVTYMFPAAKAEEDMSIEEATPVEEEETVETVEEEPVEEGEVVESVEEEPVEEPAVETQPEEGGEESGEESEEGTQASTDETPADTASPAEEETDPQAEGEEGAAEEGAEGATEPTDNEGTAEETSAVTDEGAAEEETDPQAEEEPDETADADAAEEEAVETEEAPAAAEETENEE